MMPGGGPTSPNPLLPGVSPRPPAGLPPGRPQITPPGAFPGLPPQPGLPPGTPGAGGQPDAGLLAALKAAGIELPPDPALTEDSVGRKSPRGSYDHIYEIVAHELAEWLDRMPKLLATAMRGGPHRQGPFKHPATGSQKYAIYKAKLFNDDGTPNMEGRKELLQRMTPRQYAETVHIVTRQMKREGGELVDE